MTGTIRYVFYGVAKWLKYDRPDPKYNRYGLDLYLDNQSLRSFKKSGLQLQLRDSEEGVFVKFSRPAQKIIKQKLVEQGPPVVAFSGGEKLGTLVGNGSKVSVTISVYDTPKGKGHTWESVEVLDLVPYGGGTVDAHEDLDDEPPEVSAKESAKDRLKGLPNDAIPF